ncbi:NB-ARC domain-containing protein [Thalassotalea ganghwensis]
MFEDNQKDDLVIEDHIHWYVFINFLFKITHPAKDCLGEENYWEDLKQKNKASEQKNKASEQKSEASEQKCEDSKKNPYKVWEDDFIKSYNEALDKVKDNYLRKKNNSLNFVDSKNEALDDKKENYSGRLNRSFNIEIRLFNHCGDVLLKNVEDKSIFKKLTKELSLSETEKKFAGCFAKELINSLATLKLIKTEAKEDVEKNAQAHITSYIEKSILNEKDFQNISFKSQPSSAIGRKNELAELESFFKKKKKRAVIIKGMGGLGKTFLSQMYADSVSTQYRHIVRVKGKEFAKEIDKIIKAKRGIKSKSGTPSIALEQHLVLMDKHLNGRLLVIIDDGAKNINDTLRNVCKKTRSIDFIVTLRDVDNHKDTMVGTYELKQLNSEDALALYNPSGLSIEEKEKTLKLLVDYLGGHPFMIVLVASFVEQLEDKRAEAVIKELKNKGLHTLSGSYDEEEIKQNIDQVLKISIDKLAAKSQEKLRLLSLFPNMPLNVPMLIKTFDGKISRAQISDLVKRSVLSFIGTKDEIEFHDLMFDYLQRRWEKDYLEEKFDFDAQECHLTEGVIKQLQSNKFIEIIFGFLIPHVPTVEAGKKLKRIPGRIKKCLQFWYDNFQYQQIAYDRTIFDIHEERLEKFEQFIKEHSQNKEDVCFKHLVLLKMRAQQLYSKPETEGAMRQLREIYKVVNDVMKGERQSKWPSEIINIWLYFLDAEMNTKGRQRKPEQQPHVPILELDDCNEINDEILSILPNSLKQIGIDIKPDDYPLILRAAHYWGHRGNQDEFTVGCLLSQGAVYEDIECYINSAKEAFEMAAYFRLCAVVIKGYLDGKKDKILEEIKKRTDYDLSSLHCDDSLHKNKMEVLNSVYHGISDAAHQYRGINYLDALIFACSGDEKHKKEFLVSFDKTDKMYKLVKTKDKSSILQYHHWMLCNETIKGHINNTSKLTLEAHIDSLKIKQASWAKTYDMNPPHFIKTNTVEQFKRYYHLFTKNNNGVDKGHF